MAGDEVFRKTVIDSIKRDFAVGSEDTSDIMFVGQRVVWKGCHRNNSCTYPCEPKPCS